MRTPRLVSGSVMIACFCLLAAGCPGAQEDIPGGMSSGPEKAAPGDQPVDQPSSDSGGAPMSIQLTSTAFEDGKPIPVKYTGEGEDVSPPLKWSGVPDEARELAIICDDPDAPTNEPWVHWVIYKIPPSVSSLPEGVLKNMRLQDPPGALQGRNSWPSGQTIGYRGPMPPPGHGPHRYFFRIYALDAKLSTEPGATKSALLADMKGHIIAEGQLVGTYERR